MSLFKKLAGVVNTFFQIGGPGGPGINDNSGVLEAKNAGNSAFVVMRGATPSGDNDLTTKAYVDEATKTYIVTAQSNAASALIANTGTEHFIVVSAAGTGAAAAYVAGSILFDDGTSVGNVVVLGPTVGVSIITTTSLTGGTFTFNSNTEYAWTGSTWLNLAPSIGGAEYVIDMVVGTGAAQSSVTIIPANAIITYANLNITTPFSGGATIAVGQTGTTGLLLGTADNVPQTADQYVSDSRVAWGASPLAVLITVAGSPGAGAGTLTVKYSSPLS